MRVRPSFMPARPTKVNAWTMCAVGLTAAALLVSGCSGSPSPSPTPQSDPSRAPSDADIATAEALVQQKVVEFGADLTSATLRVRDGIVQNPNTGSQRCDSGRLLRIKMIGTFSKIQTTGGPPMDPDTSASPQDMKVHGVLMDADAASGEACMISVQTGVVTPDPEATVLSLD